jgi:SAM-dependent methyltransferase
MVDAWKDERLPMKQLELNKRELEGAYPDHWKALLDCLRVLPNDTRPFYDIGCGVGSTCALLSKEGFAYSYLGLDFSVPMIETARSSWSGAFAVDDYRSTTRTMSDGIVYCTGLLDIVDDGVRELSRILSFGSPHVILNRINLGHTRHLRSYWAYNLIPCYSYTFSTQEFYDTITRNGYSILHQIGNCFLLRKTQ